MQKCLFIMKESSLANRTASAKAHGNLTPAWFYPAVPLCQRCYIITRTKAVRKYHYHDRKVMAAAIAVSCLWNAGRNRYPVSSLLWGLRRASPTALFLSKRIRLLYAALIRRFFSMNTWFCQPVKMHW